jgi:hypothetical protein
MYGRVRRGQRDYFAYLNRDGKERRSTPKDKTATEMGAAWSIRLIIALF